MLLKKFIEKCNAEKSIEIVADGCSKGKVKVKGDLAADERRQRQGQRHLAADERRYTRIGQKPKAKKALVLGLTLKWFSV